MVRTLAGAVGLASLAGAVRLRKPEAHGPTGVYRQVLHNHQDMQYFADFHIGGQEISGIFDTGSFELLVRSTRCEHCAHPTPAYDHKLSTTYVENGTITKHVFGSGPCISIQ